MNLCEHGEYAESNYAYIEKALEKSMHVWRRRKETRAFSQNAERYKTEHISVNNISK
jgi:hypothetical protein